MSQVKNVVIMRETIESSNGEYRQMETGRQLD